MLRDIKNLFKNRVTLDISEVANSIKVSESAIDGMLKLLEKKNFIKKINLECNSCSSSCSNCPFSSQKDIYKLVS